MNWKLKVETIPYISSINHLPSSCLFILLSIIYLLVFLILFWSYMASVEYTFWLQVLQKGFGFLFFGFTILFSFLSVLVYILRLKPWCSCDSCRSYLTSSWSHEFNNLCDWYSHLLQKSPTGTIHVHVLSNIITANPKNVEYIIKTRFENFPKGKPFSALLGDLLGRGIFNVEIGSASWREGG